MALKNCVVCGEEFDTTDRGRAAKMCSNECSISKRKSDIRVRSRLWRKNNPSSGTVRKCEVCRGQFNTKERTNSAKTCSEECSKSLRVPPIMIACAMCGTIFRKYGGAMNCSKKCSDEYSVYLRKARRLSTYKYKYTEKRCVVCAGGFTGFESDKYCSKVCKNYQRRGYVTKGCKRCGIEFNPDGQSQFCGEVCREAWMEEYRRKYTAENQQATLLRARKWADDNRDKYLSNLRKRSRNKNLRINILKALVESEEQ